MKVWYDAHIMDGHAMVWATLNYCVSSKVQGQFFKLIPESIELWGVCADGFVCFLCEDTDTSRSPVARPMTAPPRSEFIYCNTYT